MPGEYPCTICGKIIKRKGDLARHQRLHDDKKPFQCNLCPKAFAQSTALKTHLNTHSKEKPYKCGMDSCKAAFGDPSSCARHRKEKHIHAVTYRCFHPGCNSTIKRRATFIGHLKKHGIDISSVDVTASLVSTETMPNHDMVPAVPPNMNCDFFDQNIPFQNSMGSSYMVPQATPQYMRPITQPVYGGQYFFHPGNDGRNIHETAMLEQRPYFSDMPLNIRTSSLHPTSTRTPSLIASQYSSPSPYSDVSPESSCSTPSPASYSTVSPLSSSSSESSASSYAVSPVSSSAELPSESFAVSRSRGGSPIQPPSYGNPRYQMMKGGSIDPSLLQGSHWQEQEMQGFM